MIVPPIGGGTRGVAFTDVGDGDLRLDGRSRAAVSDRLGISASWAVVRQVHGASVLRADGPGAAGDADAIWTETLGLPVAILTADCLPVAIVSDSAVGVAHAGWRGVVSGVVGNLVGEMSDHGHPPLAAYIGPGIGPCCFEVGDEVAGLFEDKTRTTWGRRSVDLASAVRRQLDGIETWQADGCTRHEGRFFSHRRNATMERQAGVGWVG